MTPMIALPAAASLIFVSVASAAEMPQRAYPNDWYFGKPEQQAKHAKMEGKPAPKLDLSDWMNGELTGENTEGKILVVDFWATWCGPCIRAIPHNNEIAKKYADDGVLVLGVCGSRNGQEKMRAVAEKEGIEYPIAKDATYASAKAWQVMWWPTYAVVDREGNVAAIGLKPKSVDKVIDDLLEKEGKAKP